MIWEGIDSVVKVQVKDGKIMRFNIYQPSNSEMKTKVKRKRVKQKEYDQYWNHLKNCLAEKKHHINKSQLNIIKKPGKEKGTMLVKSISDGTTYHFGIYQDKNYVANSSYSPKSFIEDKFPGFEERQKLVDLIAGFESLTE